MANNKTLWIVGALAVGAVVGYFAYQYFISATPAPESSRARSFESRRYQDERGRTGIMDSSTQGFGNNVTIA